MMNRGERLRRGSLKTKRRVRRFGFYDHFMKSTSKPCACFVCQFREHRKPVERFDPCGSAAKGSV